jgi:hypothetical protein
VANYFEATAVKGTRRTDDAVAQRKMERLEEGRRERKERVRG